MVMRLFRSAALIAAVWAGIEQGGVALSRRCIVPFSGGLS
jgi:hypothetical protein